MAFKNKKTKHFVQNIVLDLTIIPTRGNITQHGGIVYEQMFGAYRKRCSR